MKKHFTPMFWLLGTLIVTGSLLADSSAAVPADELVPCQVHQRVRISFPARPFHEGVVRGEASLMVEVHSDGQLGDVLAITHSGADFARAAIDAVKQWEFTPATLGGEPIASNITVNVNFAVDGVIAYTKLIGQAGEQPRTSRRNDYRPYSLVELDGVPFALARPGPVYPKEWIDQGVTGEVTVDFYIDEDGHTRFVHLVGRADDMLAAAAVDAVKAWRFEPPTRHGRPVLAKVRQVFYFRPDRKPAS